jgi:hypothetical protein
MKTITRNGISGESLALGQRKSARLMNLCSQRLKDICHHFRSGAGALWEIPHDIGGIYLNQLVRESREEVFDTRTGSTILKWQEAIKNQHNWDCETLPDFRRSGRGFNRRIEKQYIWNSRN